MILKTYISKTNVSVRVSLDYGLSALITFKPEIGGGSVFETTDTSLQNALEQHSKYGKLFSLESSETVAESRTVPKVQYYDKESDMGNVLTFDPQMLTDSEKEQARDNIGAATESEELMHAVRFTPQNLNESQKEQARENIDAQKTLTFDTTPTEGSENPVTSNGVKKAIDEATGKARETVVVTASADSGDVSASAELTVKSGGEVIATGTGSLSLAIEYGKVYTVEAARVYDYMTPAVQTFTASQSVRNVTCAYTYIARDTITLDQSESDDEAMITGDVQGDVIKAIRAASHLYLGTQTEDGNQLICQLSDSDGTKYADGTTAAMDGTEGDQWMKLPVFWWKVTPVGTVGEDGAYDQYQFSFAFAGEPDPSWKKWEGNKNLLGAKEMTVVDGKGYTVSGGQSTGSFTQPAGKGYASARGTGYSLVTWEWQWMMCVLFYAWYGRTNSQAQCGKGSNSYTRTLGTKDSLGMTDTTASNGNSDNTKFWGIENWWGCKYEWMGNVTTNNYVATVVDMNTGESRTVSGWVQCGGTGGWTSRMKVTEHLDFVPIAKDGTETTYFCDWVNANSGSRVVGRSHYYASTGGGVAYVSADYGSSSSLAHVGSRLAFNGVVTEAESVEAYKAALAA